MSFEKIFQVILVIAASTCPLRAELANAIVAVVDSAVITYHDIGALNAQTADLLVREYSNNRTERERKLTEMDNENREKLVEHELILREFRTAGYSLPESVLDDLVQETIKSSYGDRATLTKTLEAQGITYEKFRQQIKERFIESQLRFKNISSEIIVSPNKIQHYYLDHREDFKEEDRIKLRRIALNYATQNGAERTRELAKEILDRLKEGAPFDEMASLYSEDSAESRQGVWYARSALRRELSEEAFKLKPGQTSEIIETPSALYIIKAEEIIASHYKPLGEVRKEIESNLLITERRRLEKQWIEKLKRKTFVQYFF